MKLEQMHKSHLYHDSLGEITFYFRFMQQLSANMRQTMSKHSLLHIANCRLLVLAYFDEIGRTAH
jgi:hypothetical protein